MNNVIYLWDRKSGPRITVKEMAELLAVNPETIRRYIRFERVPESCWVQNAKGEYLIDPHEFVEALPWVTVEPIKETVK